MAGTPGFTLLDIARDQVPLTAVRLTLTNEVTRHGAARLRLHAAEPTCWEMANGRQQVLKTETLAHLAQLHGTGFGSEPVRLCERCDDPTYVRHRREVAEVVTDTAAWHQLRFQLFSVGKDPDPSPDKLGLLAQYLIEVGRTIMVTRSPVVATFLSERLDESYTRARALRDIAAAAEPAPRDVDTGPWVAVGVYDLERIWRSGIGRRYLAEAPGNIFDTPAAPEHVTGGRVRAVLALPPDKATIWASENAGFVRAIDVAITTAEVPHLSLVTRLWAQNPSLDLGTALQLAVGIATPAGR